MKGVSCRSLTKLVSSCHALHSRFRAQKFRTIYIDILIIVDPGLVLICLQSL